MKRTKPGPFVCERCRRSYGKHAPFIMHKRVCGVCKFPRCSEVFTDLEELKKHVSEKHAGELVCKFCGLYCQKRTRLITHIQSQHDPKYKYVYSPDAVTCTICNKHCGRPADFARHKNHCGECQFFKCGIKFETLEILHNHVIQSHEARFMCEFCGLMCNTPSALTQHIQFVHRRDYKPEAQPTWYKCDKCGKEYNTLGPFVSHKNRCGVCQFLGCGIKFETLETLHNHVIQSHEAEFICKFCGYDAKKRRAFSIHMQNQHNENYEIPQVDLTCEICNRKYKTSWLSSQHKTFCGFCQFPECGEQFADLTTLRSHVTKNHSGENMCSGCGQIYKSNYYLNRHLENNPQHVRVESSNAMPRSPSPFSTSPTTPIDLNSPQPRPPSPPGFVPPASPVGFRPPMPPQFGFRPPSPPSWSGTNIEPLPFDELPPCKYCGRSFYDLYEFMQHQQFCTKPCN